MLRKQFSKTLGSLHFNAILGDNSMKIIKNP